MSNIRKLLVACAIVLLVPFHAAAEQENVDHPLVKRFPGSYIQGAEAPAVRDFDEFELIVGPIRRSPNGTVAPAKVQRLEGRITTVTYHNPQNRSVLEIYRNYEQSLTREGFKVLFSCNGAECGEATECCPHPMFYDPSYVRRFLAAKLARAEGDVYVSLAVQSQTTTMEGDTQLDVIEVKPMEIKQLVDAGALAGDITRMGHAAVYGILFDTGKADIKPESDAVLREIARLLQQNPKLKLYVVGHTDNAGSLQSNMDLSRRRADAVVTALTSKHGVSAARLLAAGDGPTAPVASNDSEEGRAKNRRVELVKQ